MLFHCRQEVFVGLDVLSVNRRDNVSQYDVISAYPTRTNHPRIIRWEASIGPHNGYAIDSVALNPLIRSAFNTEHRTKNFPVGNQLRNDLFHRADWNRESNARAGTARRVDGGVYAD